MFGEKKKRFGKDKYSDSLPVISQLCTYVCNMDEGEWILIFCVAWTFTTEMK